MSNKGRLIILSAPSGTGKTTVTKRLLSLLPNTVHSISYTNRPRRFGEKEGEHYHFVDTKTFEKMIQGGKFVEWTQYVNHYYGTSKKDMSKELKQGKDILLDLDIQGGLALKRQFPKESVSIFILPPSLEELEKRLFKRGTDDVETRKKRMEQANRELSFKDQYDYQIVNDDLEGACQRILALLDKKL